MSLFQLHNLSQDDNQTQTLQMISLTQIFCFEQPYVKVIINPEKDGVICLNDGTATENGQCAVI
jgi:hypothetical protein